MAELATMDIRDRAIAVYKAQKAEVDAAASENERQRIAESRAKRSAEMSRLMERYLPGVTEYTYDPEEGIAVLDDSTGLGRSGDDLFFTWRCGECSSWCLPDDYNDWAEFRPRVTSLYDLGAAYERHGNLVPLCHECEAKAKLATEAPPVREGYVYLPILGLYIETSNIASVSDAGNGRPAHERTSLFVDLKRGIHTGGLHVTQDRDVAALRAYLEGRG